MWFKKQLSIVYVLIIWLEPPMLLAPCAHPEALVSRAKMCVTRSWRGAVGTEKQFDKEYSRVGVSFKQEGLEEAPG